MAATIGYWPRRRVIIVFRKSIVAADGKRYYLASMNVPRRASERQHLIILAASMSPLAGAGIEYIGVVPRASAEGMRFMKPRSAALSCHIQSVASGNAIILGLWSCAGILYRRGDIVDISDAVGRLWGCRLTSR